MLLPASGSLGWKDASSPVSTSGGRCDCKRASESAEKGRAAEVRGGGWRWNQTGLFKLKLEVASVWFCNKALRACNLPGGSVIQLLTENLNHK